MEKLNMHKMDRKGNGDNTERETEEEFGEESRRDSPFRFVGSFEEETPRKRFKRFEGGMEGHGGFLVRRWFHCGHSRAAGLYLHLGTPGRRALR